MSCDHSLEENSFLHVELKSQSDVVINVIYLAPMFESSIKLADPFCNKIAIVLLGRT